MFVWLIRFLLSMVAISILGTVYTRPEFRQAVVAMMEMEESEDYDDSDDDDYDGDGEYDNGYAYDEYDNSDYD